MEDAPTFYVPEKKADTTWGGKNFTEMKTIDELLLDQLEFRVTHPVLQTGFSGLDQREAPLLRWGALTLLTARPAMGKTSLSCQIVANVAKAGHRAAIISLSRSAGDIIQVLKQGKNAVACSSSIWIEDRIHRLEMVETLLNNIPDGPDLIVVDEPGRYAYCREEGGEVCREMGKIYRKLKGIAETFHAAVLCTEKADRRVEQEQYPMPLACDIPDWEDIEPFVDTVCAFYSPSYYSEEAEKTMYGRRGISAVYLQIGPSREGCAHLTMWQRKSGRNLYPLYFETLAQALEKK